ncbi:NAD(P)-dependent oxidoreductase [Ktedonosporobacter rubrisoli]|uniref:NAD(P)-dependent oxidoreductase n=1 Tax=Ktedonosporobacter rubrisoli TaxID=2509675 RepID=A0A4P6JHY5_KTERU|nr:NAD(P)-dependent oxidoreductase [Ktedonosporobacter rubrisoli]QBD74553.1 NAD(P)-dependent oxidoreductase [Ktedonosporobacter rubrisoli]
MAKLGFIGLGAMGGRIAKRLLEAGHVVIGYNRTQAKAQWLLDAGMQWGQTPRAVAEMAEISFSMLTDTNALENVVNGSEGILAGLRAGKIYVDMSTVSPKASQEIAGRVAAQGASMLDAPVSGSPITLEAGQLAIMVGGEKEIFEKVKPILLDIGPKVNYVGANGLALAMKIAINLSLPVQLLAFSEGVVLAEKVGIPRETAMEVWLNTVLASPSLKYRTPFILKKPDEVMFNVNMMQKDLVLAQEMGRSLDVPLPTVAAANEMLTIARAMGWGQEDFAILFKVLAHLAGIESQETQNS